jgi:hypothetical protein
MNAAPIAENAMPSMPISGPSKFVLICFLFFFGLMGALALIDLGRALIR